MVDVLLDSLAPVLTRWTMGGSAVALAPGEWRAALGEDSGEAELRLLALSGQFLGALTLAEPAGEISVRADIPALANPPIPDALRPRARRMLQQLREAGQRRDLLVFLDGRGWTLHPGDWMPTGSAEEDVPEIYSPWQDWAAASGAVAREAADELTAESWEDFGPAARRTAFASLRRRDPARAAALLGEKIAGEAPDRRVQLVALLATGLSEADGSLLQTLGADRAPRVKALAASLLARLGEGGESGEDIAELAAFFTAKTKGLLRRTLTIAAQPLKTPAQRNRRAALMEAVTIGALAEALGLAPAAFIEAWPWGEDDQADHALAGMIERSGTDAAVGLAAAAMTAGRSMIPHVLAPLLPRLTPVQRREAAVQQLCGKGGSFAQAQSIAGGDGRIDDAMATAAGRAVLATLKDSDAKPSDQAAELLALGLLASRGSARRALEILAGAGVIASDPRLDMLRLNAALEDREKTK